MSQAANAPTQTPEELHLTRIAKEGVEHRRLLPDEQLDVRYADGRPVGELSLASPWAPAGGPQCRREPAGQRRPALHGNAPAQARRDRRRRPHDPAGQRLAPRDVAS